MDGESLAHAIKADPQLKDTVLIMLTSCGRRGDAKRMEEAGFSADHTKPMRFSQILDTLRKVWALSQSNGVASSGLVTRYSLGESASILTRPTRNKLAKKCRLLVVEDNRVNQKVALNLLEQLMDATWNLPQTERSALRMVESAHYDILFMDCRMPVMDGYKATAEIRRREDLGPHRIIVAMTANAMQEDRERCLQAGMDDYIPKPINRAELVRVLDRFVPSWDHTEDEQKPVVESEAT